MSDIINELKLSLNELAITLELFSEKLSYLNFEGHDPKQHKHVINVIKELNKWYAKFTIPDVLLSRAEFYEKLKETLQTINDIIDVYDKYDVEIDFSSSDTSSSNNIYKLIETAWMNLLTSRNKYKSLLNSNEHEIIVYLCKGKEKDFEKVITEIVPNVHNAPMLIYMINQSENPSIIESFTELLKNKILLNSSDIARKTSAPDNAMQRLIQKNRLVPVGISLPLKDTIELIQPGITNFKDLCKLKSNKYRFGYIIIKKLLTNPHEMNLWTLTNIKYINKNKLMTKEESGINDIVLQRFKTIIPMETANRLTGNPIDIYDDLFKSDKSYNFYYIFETLNNIDYRILKSDFYLEGYPYVVPAADFDLDKIPQKRVPAYNGILENEIIKHLSEPLVSIAESYSSTYKRVNDIKWNLFRKRIIDAMIEWYEKQPAPTSEDAFALSLVSKKIIKHLSQSIISSISLEDAKVVSLLNDVHHTELQLSYTSDLSAMLTKFEQIIEDVYNREFKEDLLKRNVSENRYRKIFQELIEQIIPMLVNRKSNIYQQLMHKAEILTKTIPV